jgi:hypothetical protein
MFNSFKESLVKVIALITYFLCFVSLYNSLLQVFLNVYEHVLC